jgi:hypothetical protein
MTDLKLEKLLGECRKHVKRLTRASEKINREATFAELEEEFQVVLRF